MIVDAVAVESGLCPFVVLVLSSLVDSAFRDVASTANKSSTVWEKHRIRLNCLRHNLDVDTARQLGPGTKWSVKRGLQSRRSLVEACLTLVSFEAASHAAYEMLLQVHVLLCCPWRPMTICTTAVDSTQWVSIATYHAVKNKVSARSCIAPLPLGPHGRASLHNAILNHSPAQHCARHI
jgi:hypothetical protein